MNLAVVSAAVFRGEELQALQPAPEWRKASRNMVMASLSVARALASAAWPIDELGLVLGSSSGELETSAEFMRTLSLNGMARPVLFQNSLHNATTGFASIHFRIRGPSFTVSCFEKTPSESVKLAAGLLADESCRACVVTIVEAHKTLAEWIGESDLAEGAVSVLFSTPESCAEKGLIPRALISSDRPGFDFKPSEGDLPILAMDSCGLYAHALEWERAP